MFFNRKPKQKIIVLGIDGAEPEIVERLLEEGQLPNLQRLKTQGSYGRMQTTATSQSPVAWSSFLTGMNPGKHGIVDFIVRNPSKLQIDLGLNDFTLVGGRISYHTKRKGTPFWNYLGAKGFKAASLFIPVTFPPEPVKNGWLISGMGVPDIRGTQGSPTIYTTDRAPEGKKNDFIEIEFDNNKAETFIRGPNNSQTKVYFLRQNGGIAISFDGLKAATALRQGQWSGWQTIVFDAGNETKEGVCRFKLLKDHGALVKIYLSPVLISPFNPFTPITYPDKLAGELAEELGVFKSASFESDVYALKEELIDEETWLEDMHFTLENKKNLVAYFLKEKEADFLCVNFFAVDRVQHLFWRYIDPKHARFEKNSNYAQEIDNAYMLLDHTIGELIELLPEDAIVFVMSDHGFAPYRKNVQVNNIFQKAGLLALKNENGTFNDIDWAKTKAYAVGFGGLYINLQDREKEGIVPAQEFDQVREKVIKVLKGFKDNGKTVFKDVKKVEEVYFGELIKQGPDLIPFYTKGYKIAKASALGGADLKQPIVKVSQSKWSGEHVGPFLPEDCPAVLFCSKKLDLRSANIMDLAPTILHLAGLKVPSDMDGKVLKQTGE